MTCTFYIYNSGSPLITLSIQSIHNTYILNTYTYPIHTRVRTSMHARTPDRQAGRKTDGRTHRSFYMYVLKSFTYRCYNISVSILSTSLSKHTLTKNNISAHKTLYMYVHSYLPMDFPSSGLRRSLSTQHSNLKCLKPLMCPFTLAVCFKTNIILFQILYETIFDWY